MRIITEKRLEDFARAFPDARSWLEHWTRTVRPATWRNIQEVRRQFPTADGVTVKSKRIVTVFNARGNTYRLIAALHYDKQRVFMLRFLTHAEYDKNQWKEQL